MSKISIYSDGGARGNPGPAASAFVVFDSGGKVIYKYSKYLGKATNNYAEYQGVILALNWLMEDSQEGYQEINFFLDSELVVKQIVGLYKVKEPTLKTLHSNVKDLLRNLSVKIIFQSVLREKNKLADSLVNEELDKNMS